MGTSLGSSLLKLSRAEEHLAVFRAELTDWKASSPGSISKTRNADGSRHSVFLDLHKPPPVDRWSLIAGDCIHNLRSSLDHLVYALAVRNTGVAPRNFKQLQFPIVETPEGFEKQRYRIAGLSPEAQASIEKVQPYNRRHPEGPTALSVLNDLDNSDKHRMISVVIMLPGSGEITYKRPPRGSPRIQWLTAPISAGAEAAVLLLDPPQPDFEFHVKLWLDAVVRHVPGPNGSRLSPLLAVLEAIRTEVRTIIAGFS